MPNMPRTQRKSSCTVYGVAIIAILSLAWQIFNFSALSDKLGSNFEKDLRISFFASAIFLFFSVMVSTYFLWRQIQRDERREAMLINANNELNQKNSELEARTLEVKLREAALRDIFDQAAEGILVADAEGHYVELNRAAEDMLGYRRSELIGRNFQDFISFDEIPRFNSLKEKMLKPGDINVSKWHLKTKTGVFLEVEVTGKIYPDKSWMTFIRDITQKQDSFRRLTFLSEISQIFNETLDFYGRLQKTAESLVPSFADICIISVFEEKKLILGATIHRDPLKSNLLIQVAKQIMDLETHHEERDFLIAGNSIFIDNISASHFPIDQITDKYKSCFGTLQITSYIAIPMRARGKTIGILSLARTEVSKNFTEDDFIFAKAISYRCALAADNAKLFLDALNALKDREHLLSIVSHDLKNPLFAIQMAIKNFQKMKSYNTDEVDKISHLIENAVGLMQKLIFDLLDFTEIESGTFTVERLPVDVVGLVNSALDILSLAIKEKNINFKLEASDKLPQVFCDKGRIIQVLWNLMGNAIKFTPTGGEIELKVERQDNLVLFSVHDNGPGIKAENLNFIFQRFWQSKESKSLGTGLGLSIAKGIIEAHGGRIWAESQVGLGTTVFFTIPSVQSRVHVWDKKDSAEFPLKNDFILLVDDSSDLRLLMRMLLERVGAQIVEASTVAEAEMALKQAENLPYNAIITDIDMPVEDGFVLLDRVRSSAFGKNVPVIALTGFSAPEEIEKIMKAGFNLCFTKPVDFEKLVQAIQQLLHSMVKTDDTKRKEMLLLKQQEL